ncbi:MAG: hybrid sensor histidine kinase/response regulator [Anaerolineae bacterium]|nr:hybrid sensor histidine kinase/response regulator [Anaerolineae bacterium]
MSARTELLARDLQDLRRQYLKLLIVVGAVLVWSAAMRFFSHDSRWERTWPVLVAVLAAVVLGGALLRRHFGWAALAVTLCLSTAVLLEVHLVGGVLSLAMLPALVVLVSAMSAPLTLLTGGYLALGLLLQARLGPPGGLPLEASLASVLLVSAASLASSHQFQTAFSWARSAAHRAEKAAADSQDRRREAIKAVTAMRNAYYLLERTNHALAQTQAELVEARRLKTEFVNMVSHELRAPLNYIVGFSELMVNSPEVYSTQPWPPRLLQDLTEIYRSSSHLSRLIDDILDLAQIEAHRLLLRREYCDLATVAREAASIVRPWQERKGLALEEHYEDDLPPLYLDRTRVRQVVLNLLNNAVRFTDEGKITLRVYRHRGEVLLSVSDTGPGIPEDKLDRIFEEFVRLDAPGGRPVEGTGLGLAISRRLVQMHGGRVWATSQVGRGSTFFVSFAPASQEAVPATRGIPPSYWEELQKQGLSRDILLCLGREEVRASLAEELPEYDVVLGHASAVASAVRELRPRAVVVDQRDTNPEEVRDLLDEVPDDVPVVSLSLHGSGEDRLEGTEAHLVKPVSRARLLETLARVCPGAEEVLVVDDDPRMQRFIRATLESADRRYRVYAVGSAAEALQRVRLGSTHVILLDLRLPDMDGTDLLRLLRRDGALKQVPVITVSAVVNPGEDLSESRETFAVSCKRRLGKPQVMQLLRTSLDEIPPRRHWEELEPEPAAGGGG